MHELIFASVLTEILLYGVAGTNLDTEFAAAKGIMIVSGVGGDYLSYMGIAFVYSRV